MQLPRPRFTVRWLMAAVGIVEILVALVVRSRQFREVARNHELQGLGAHLEVRYWLQSGGADEKSVLVARAKVAWHDAMAMKYERASRYPWLPAAPDPSVPR